MPWKDAPESENLYFLIIRQVFRPFVDLYETLVKALPLAAFHSLLWRRGQACVIGVIHEVLGLHRVWWITPITQA